MIIDKLIKIFRNNKLLTLIFYTLSIFSKILLSLLVVIILLYFDSILLNFIIFLIILALRTILGRMAQLVRAFRSHRKGPWFESRCDHHSLLIYA